MFPFITVVSAISMDQVAGKRHALMQHWGDPPGQMLGE